MNDKDEVAKTLRKFADDVQYGRIKWVWLATKYTDGMTLKYATGTVPKRPGGF